MGATEHHSFQPQEQEHDAQQFAEYEALERLISEPNAFDEPATQQEFVKQVRDQLHNCAQATAAVVEHDNDFATKHSVIVVLVIVPNQVLLGWKNSLIPLCHSNLYSNTHAHNNNIPLRAQALTFLPP